MDIHPDDVEVTIVQPRALRLGGRAYVTLGRTVNLAFR
jgi:hypothetical protein